MKKIVWVLLCFLSARGAYAQGITPLSNGFLFGITEGKYEGEGFLHSDSMWIPDLNFTSIRTLSGGVIEAQTTASLFNTLDLATAHAKLQVVPTDAVNFTVLNLEQSDSSGNPLVAGQGACEQGSCTFTATVMSGALTLTETWMPTPEGFKIVNGVQVFKNIRSTYEGNFSR